MAVFPERMRPIDPKDVESSLKTIEEYIRYMTERMEFAHSNDSRFLSEVEQNMEILNKRVAKLEN